MSTLQENIDQVSAAFQDIKRSLIQQNIELPQNVPIKNYAAYISQIGDPDHNQQQYAQRLETIINQEVTTPFSKFFPVYNNFTIGVDIIKSKDDIENEIEIENETEFLDDDSKAELISGLDKRQIIKCGFRPNMIFASCYIEELNKTFVIYYGDQIKEKNYGYNGIIFYDATNIERYNNENDNSVLKIIPTLDGFAISTNDEKFYNASLLWCAVSWAQERG